MGSGRSAGRRKADKSCTAPQKLDTFGVFFMKYNYEIRLKAVKLVLEGG
ncbi:MAG: transposase, partial [Alistipes finegoldii]|nr:transposase [Alistipes finegoldii]